MEAGAAASPAKTREVICSAETDAMPTAAELELISSLRERFAEDLSRRKAEGRDHSCCFGDLALVRALRGNEGDLERTCEWFARFLETYETENLEVLVVEMTRRLDQAGGRFGSNDFLLCNDELKEYASALFSLPQLAPNGDVITYIPVISTDKRAILEKGLFLRYAQFMRSALILRMIELDRESHAQQRIVKVASIFDLAGCSLGWLSCPKFDKEFDQHVGKFSERVAAELYGTFHVINPPWFVSKLYKLARRYIPEKLQRRLFFVEGDPSKDTGILGLVGGPGQLQQLFRARGDFMGTSEQNSGDQEVPRRQIFERCVEAAQGQRISWTFQVVRGTGDLLMGTSDIDFEVVAFWTADEDGAGEPSPGTPAGLEGESLVPVRRVAASDGEVRGSIEAPRAGLVLLRWSNAHSMMRGKTVRFSIATGQE